MEHLLTHFFAKQKISDYEIRTFFSGRDLLQAFMPTAYDLIFLDVIMPELNGFQTAEQVRQVDAQVNLVFVTNLRNYVQKGFEYNAKGYLYKDVDQNQIDSLLERLLSEQQHRWDNSYQVRLKNEHVNSFLDLTEILYFEIHNKDTYGITENDTFIFRKELGNVEEDLKNRGFLRIHRSYLVNVNKIFKKFNNFVTLRNGTEIPISRKYKPFVNEKLKGRWK